MRARGILPLAAAVLLLARWGTGSPAQGADPTASPAAAARSPALAQALDREVASALSSTAALGVHVAAIDTGETVYAYDPDDARILASNTKLFTTAAALEALGPGFFFETRLVLRGEVRAGDLEGDLGVVGGGDPGISGRDYGGDSYAVFRPWARDLAARGIRRVRGNLYLDHGLFAGPTVHPDWPREQLSSWYEAPVDALSFSDDCILVRVTPTRPGAPVRVETIPAVPVFRLDSSARTSGARKAHRLTISRSDDVLRVSGTIGAGPGPFDTWITVPDPVDYFGKALVAALAEEGIAVSGRLIPVERLPGPVWERVSVYRSDLASAVEVTNKRSQNFYAESLVKQLGARRCGEGSWREGVRAVREFAVAIGIPAGTFTMNDGSGMSRENRFAPRHVTTLLRHMYRSPAGLVFARSLPFGGEDNGAWKRRLAEPPYRGNVSAKTGTLEGVSALSGYAKGVSGRLYAFSVLCNRVRDGGAVRGAEDRIVKALVDNG